MECPHCKQQTPGIIDQNHLWCDKCGVSIRSHCEFVPSYNNCHYAPRQQVYSRVKRFMKFVRDLANPLVIRKFDAIVDLYSSFEFTWTCNRESSKRIYFYAKCVMLQVCCELLDVKTELPKLKDRTREIDQHRELNILSKTEAFKVSTESRGFI